MNTLFELLYRAWCPKFDIEHMPKSLRGDPVNACGIYAFEQGFRLALSLAVTSLDPSLLARWEEN